MEKIHDAAPAPSPACIVAQAGDAGAAHNAAWLAGLSMDELLGLYGQARAQVTLPGSQPFELQRQASRAVLYREELRQRLAALRSEDLELLMTTAQHEAVKAPLEDCAREYFARAELYKAELERRTARREEISDRDWLAAELAGIPEPG